jgi:hypothetical protein
MGTNDANYEFLPTDKLSAERITKGKRKRKEWVA